MYFFKKNISVKVFTKTAVGLVLILSLASQALAEDKPNKGKFYGDIRLRYEGVDQDNVLEDADAVTLRTRLGYKTPSAQGFSGVIEVEGVTELVDDFSFPPVGIRPGQFSVVADPEGLEIDQALIQYNNEKLAVKIGRQVITLDGHRFVGHVGWRQDRQTFDAIRVNYRPSKDFVINASYLDQRNRIFSDEADIESEDVILNSAFTTSFGKFVGYAYLLEEDTDAGNEIDTYGISFTGSRVSGENKFSYAAEFAVQEINDSFDTEYLKLEGGLTFGVGGANKITAKVGYELLGSDEGLAGFTTPLATLHKFNGWSDQFLGTPSQGLEDLYAGLWGTAFGGNWVAVYHDFSSDENLNGSDDLGSEINLLYTRKFGKGFSGGIKYADYSAGDAGFNRVDTQRAWLWGTYSF